jgi:hypothetical protein
VDVIPIDRKQKPFKSIGTQHNKTLQLP